MQDTRAELRAFMKENGLSQITLAERARVSQSTVSRALSRIGLRHGAARARLFSYAKIAEWSSASAADDPRNAVLAAFERVWDHSKEHAAAVARVIDALADLRPRPKGDDG